MRWAVDVTPVSGLPLAVSDHLAVEEGDTLLLESSDLLANDSDVDSEILWVANVGDAIGGSVRLEGTDIVFEHNGSEDALAGYTYSVSDGIADSKADVLIKVQPVNDPRRCRDGQI